MYTDLDSYKEGTIYTVNQLLDIINENFTSVQIMGSLRLHELTEKLSKFKLKNSMSGIKKVENTQVFIDELKKIKNSK